MTEGGKEKGKMTSYVRLKKCSFEQNNVHVLEVQVYATSVPLFSYGFLP
jgi:hypothetical protein